MDGRICNVCGLDFSLCKHVPGKEYAGVLCVAPEQPAFPQQSWKSETCGTCAWAGQRFIYGQGRQTARDGSRDDNRECAYCRRIAWGHYVIREEIVRVLIESNQGVVFTDTPACPAWDEKP